MEESERIKKQRELIEYIGIQQEREGIQPAAARIMGLLLVMDKEEFTFEEIVEETKMSKSSVSNALKNLELRGAIEYITYQGDRKRYFRFVNMDMCQLIDQIEKKSQNSKDILEQIVSLKKDPKSKSVLIFRHILVEMDHFINSLKGLKENYKNQQ